MVHGLSSCPESCAILVPLPGIKPKSPALQGRFLTTGPQGNPQHSFIGDTIQPISQGCPLRPPTSDSARLSLLTSGPASCHREEPVLQDFPETQRTVVHFASTCLTDFLLWLYFRFPVDFISTQQNVSEKEYHVFHLAFPALVSIRIMAGGPSLPGPSVAFDHACPSTPLLCTGRPFMSGVCPP